MKRLQVWQAVSLRSAVSISGSLLLLFLSIPLSGFASELAYLRAFADLGERGGATTYSLHYRGPQSAADGGEAEPLPLFTGLNGGFASNPGTGAITLPAGPHRFVLRSDQGGAPVSFDAELEAGAMYSLLAATDASGVAHLRISKEYPLAEGEARGIRIHHLMSGVPLALQVGESAPRRIPFSQSESYFLPATEVQSAESSLSYPNRRGGARTRTLDYRGEPRLLAIFYRNGYGQPTLSILPVEPEREESTEVSTTDDSTTAE